MKEATATTTTTNLKQPIDEPIPAAPSYEHDIVLFAVVLALVGFGIVMVYSASAVYATQKFGSATYFLRRDLLWSALGLGAMGVAMRTDFGAYRRVSYPLLIGAIGCSARCWSSARASTAPVAGSTSAASASSRRSWPSWRWSSTWRTRWPRRPRR